MRILKLKEVEHLEKFIEATKLQKQNLAKQISVLTDEKITLDEDIDILEEFYSQYETEYSTDDDEVETPQNG